MEMGLGAPAPLRGAGGALARGRTRGGPAARGSSQLNFLRLLDTRCLIFQLSGHVEVCTAKSQLMWGWNVFTWLCVYICI